MAEVGTIMTKREKEVFQTVKELGIACPREISERVKSHQIVQNSFVGIWSGCVFL